MAVFLTLHEGNNPLDAEPVFATRDQKIISLVLEEMSKRVREQMKEPTKRPLLKFDRLREPAEA